MTAPIEQAIADRMPEVQDPALRGWLQREVLPVLRAARDIINEDAWQYESNTGDYAWDMQRHGKLFINQTSGTPNFTIDASVDTQMLRQGREYTLVIYNGTGGPITPTFSSDFNVTSVAISDASRATWQLCVKHRDFDAVSATILDLS